MTRPKTLVVTIPGMIGEADLKPLERLSAVTYREFGATSEPELAAMCDGFDYLMLNMDVVPKSGKLKLAPSFYEYPAVRSLKGIAVDMTGMDYFSPSAAEAAGVMLQNIPHYSSQSVAESIVAEVLLHSRQRHLAYQDENAGRAAEARKGINLKDRRAGIVGLGSIGSTVATLLQGLGMEVGYWNRSKRSRPGSMTLERIFGQSDVICICAATVLEGPSANVGLIGKQLFDRCRGTIVVNLSNPLLVDTKALVSGLESGKVAAYSVEASEDLRSALRGFPQVHFAPPNAWNSDESMAMLRKIWVDNVISAINRQPRNVYRT
jgi:glycerate dehydrogenase